MVLKHFQLSHERAEILEAAAEAHCELVSHWSRYQHIRSYDVDDDDDDDDNQNGEYYHDTDEEDDSGGAELDLWYYGGVDFQAADETLAEQEKEEKVQKSPPCDFNEIMRRFPDSGERAVGAWSPPPQYDLGSESEEGEGEAVAPREGRVCGVCGRRNVQVVYVSCRHDACVCCAKRVWCKGRMKRLRFPTWLRCQVCKGRVSTVDLVEGEEVVGEKIEVLEWVVKVSERIRGFWEERCGRGIE